MMDDSSAAYRRAAAALEVHRPEEARRILAPVVAADPYDALALSMLAEAAAVEGDWTGAHDLTRRATVAAPDDLGVLLACADIARNTDDFDAAYYWVNHALELAPDDVRALQLMGLVEISRDFIPEAVTYTREALDRRPDDPELLVGYGWALAAANRHGESTAAYLAALEIDPQHVHGMNNLAVNRLRCGDLGRASSLLTSALALDPRLQHARSNLDVVGRLARLILLSRLGLGTVAAAALAYLHVPFSGLLLVATLIWVGRSLLNLAPAVRSRLGAALGWRDVLIGILTIAVMPWATGLVPVPARPPTIFAWVVVFGAVVLAPLIWRRLTVACYLRAVGLRLPRRY